MTKSPKIGLVANTSTMRGKDQFKIHCRRAVQYVESMEISRFDFIIHAFCTRRDGVSVGSFGSLNVSVHEGDAVQNVRRNLEIIAAAFAISPQHFLFVDQVHGDGVLVIDGPIAAEHHRAAPEPCDAVVTDRPGVAICIRTADCVPMLLVDSVKKIVGVAHAGWRGTALGVVARTVDVFVNRFSSRPEDIEVAVGPAIGPCCYEVGANVYETFAGERDRHAFFHRRSGQEKWMLDLPLANIAQLEQRGVPRENISSCPLCTACRRDLFFSHRADGGKTGRQLNFVMLKDR